MRLLFLNRSFWPDIEATGQLLTELCVDLSHEHDVSVIAGPSYHVHTPQRGLWQRDALGTVRIVRTWGTRLSKAHLASRLINLGSYYVLAAAAARRLAPPDVLVAETDPPLLGTLATLLTRQWRCPFIYYCQDVYPDVAEVTGGVRNSALLSVLRHANRLAYQHAALIIVLGEDMRRRLLAKGVPSEKIAVLSNWADCDAIRPVASSPFRAQFGERFVVMFSGNLGLSQPLEVLVDAAEELRGEPGVVFAFIGAGARKAWLEAEVRQRRLPNVRFFPYQPRAVLAESLSAADLHLVPLQSGLAGCVVPSKVYGILAAGRPFVAVMEEGAEVAVLARAHGVGFVSPPSDPVALARVIRDALTHRVTLEAMGARGRRLAEQRFHRPHLTAQFAALAERVRARG